MLVLGVDPGSRACGYALVTMEGNRFVRVGGGVIKPRGETVPRKLAALLAALDELLEIHHPREAAVEKVFFGRNAHSALVLGQARGVVLAALARKGIEVSEYTAPEIKKAVTGRGAATKEQVRRMVTMMFDGMPPVSEDESDALAVAVCHCHRRKFREMGIG